MNKIDILNQIKQLQQQLEQLDEPEIAPVTYKDVIEPSDLITLFKEEKTIEFLSKDTMYLDKDFLDKIGEFIFVYQDSDYDDGVNAIEAVYYFKDFDCHVQFDGYYTSYDGYTFEDCFLVEPEEYIAIRYNKKKIKRIKNAN